MASAVETVKGSAGRIMQWIKTHPAIAGLLAVGVVVLAYIAYKNAQGGTSPTGTAQTTGQDQTGLGGGLGEIQPTPSPDLTPISTTTGGGSGGGLSGGSGGGKSTKGGGVGSTSGGATTSSSLLAPASFAPAATGPTDPFTQLLQTGYIDPTTGQVNIFETQAAGNLEAAVGMATPQQMAQMNSILNSQNLQKANAGAGGSIIPAGTPPQTATRIQQNQQDIAAVNNFFGGVGNFFNNLFGGGSLANQAAADVNQINKTVGGLFSDVSSFFTGAPIPSQTAGVVGSSIALQAPIHSEGGLAVATPTPAPPPVSPLTGLPGSPSNPAQLPQRTYATNPKKVKVGVGKRAVVGQQITNPVTGQKNVRY